jgi:hypothetical protein
MGMFERKRMSMHASSAPGFYEYRRCGEMKYFLIIVRNVKYPYFSTLFYYSFLLFPISPVSRRRRCRRSRLTAPYMSGKIVFARPLLIGRLAARNSTPQSPVRPETVCMDSVFVAIEICFYTKSSPANFTHVA